MAVGGVEQLVVERARRLGSLPFDEVMDLALYEPNHGFYASGGRAGRRGDFVTSPEIGPLFGAVVARALDTWWSEMGEPDPFVVVEAGAGSGMLARTVLGATPRCGPALRYLLVERSSSLRGSHGEHLSLDLPAFALGPVVTDADGIERPAERGVGPLVVSLGELPEVRGPVVVLANELLDNLAFRLVERRAEGWDEVRVGIDPRSTPVEQLVPATDDLAAFADAVAPAAAAGSRIPVQRQAMDWLRAALRLASPGGRVVVLDYVSTSPQLAARPWLDWLRTYVGHARGGLPLDQLGAQDITSDVCVDQLARVAAPHDDRTQADWLAGHGIDALVEEGLRTWEARAHLGDLEAIKGRSRGTEAAALTDPAGLGAFHVLEWRP